LCCHSDNCCGVARASARARLDRGRPHSQSIWSPFLLDLRNSDGYVAVEMSSSGASFPARAARWYTSAGARRSLVHVCRARSSLVHVCRARLAGTRLMPRAVRRADGRCGLIKPTKPTEAHLFYVSFWRGRAEGRVHAPFCRAHYLAVAFLACVVSPCSSGPRGCAPLGASAQISHAAAGPLRVCVRVRVRV